MKAVRIHRYGGADALVYGDAPKPAPGPGELLVRVRAAGINPVDWKIRAGKARWVLRHRLPLVPGWDFSGEVAELGAGAAGFSPGEEVFGMADVRRDGTCAEFVAVEARRAARKPAKLSHAQAAAAPLAALTAWQALFELGGLVAGRRVLIHAAAGGVGHFAVQLARWKKAVVAVTASSRNHEFLAELGADQLVDYKKERFEAVVAPVDLVVEAMGGEVERRSWRALKPGGTLVSLLNPLARPIGWLRGRRGRLVLTRSDGAQLAELARLIEAGELMPSVERVFPLSEARAAHALIEQGHVRGKLVLICG